MDFSRAQQYLDSFIDHEIHLGQARLSDFKIGRVQELLRQLKDPQKHLKIVHVAGSKGKGSICALTASILRSAGYTTGLYTSPHIDHYRERIRILKPGSPSSVSTPGVGLAKADIFPDCISKEELCGVIDAVQPAVEAVHVLGKWGFLSFFEVYTAAALYYFYKSEVDVVVLETGLGGRLDATNAAASAAAVIAPISLEHTRILGDTVAQIAGEKAGIIKDAGQKVVIAPQSDEARAVLQSRCAAFGIDPLWVSEYAACRYVSCDIKGQIFDLVTAKETYKGLGLPLLGKHQRENAATSVCLAESLRDMGFAISSDAIREGCGNVFWPGRFEAIAQEPLILLDGAHSPESARVLSETVKEVFQGKKVILILGFSEDKNRQGIHNELKGIARRIIFTKADHPRAADLAGAVSVKEALNLALEEAQKDDMILVTGSIILVAEARKQLLGVLKIENRR